MIRTQAAAPSPQKIEPPRVTPVTVTQPKPRNIVTVTADQQRITDLEARVAKLEALLTGPASKQSRAEYMREYRKRQKEA